MLPRCTTICRRTLGAVSMLIALAGAAPAPQAEQSLPGSRAFANGFPQDADFFPIGVWLQSPHNAAAFSAMGINTYVGLWRPPSEGQLAQLERHGIHLIVEQTTAARALPNAHVIRGWLHSDEPDNAQANSAGGYDDCILPEEVVRRYREIRSIDATRPVFLNFGQAVANPRWFGRGEKCSQIAPADYYRPASAGADIVSFDIYPAAEERQAYVKGRLELVGRGVANLKQWSGPGRPVWNAIEATHINNPTRRPLPPEVRSEVWMSLIHGSTGIFYFVHEWQPSFREDGIMRYPDVVQEVTRLNAQIKELAPVLNSPTPAIVVKVAAPVEIATMVKAHGGSTYLFAVNMQRESAKATLTLASPVGESALVLGEDRAVDVRGGAIEDTFAPYGVRLYKMPHRN